MTEPPTNAAAINWGLQPVDGLLTARWIVPVFLGCLLLCICRAPATLTTQHLWGEDSNILFSHYYGGEVRLSEIARHYSGYISLWSQFAAWFASQFPLGIHLKLYSLLALGMTAAAATALAFSGLLRSRIASVLGALLLAGLPFNSAIYQYNLTYSQWSALLLCVFLVVRLINVGSGWKGSVALGVGASLLAWSHPYSLLLGPACLIAALRARPPVRVALGMIMLSLICYFFTIESGNSRLSNLRNPQVLGSIASILVDEVLTFEVIRSRLPGLWILLAVGFVIAYRWTSRRLPAFDRNDALLLWLFVGAWGIYTISIKALLNADAIPSRYYYVQQVVLLVFVLRLLEGCWFDSGKVIWLPGFAAGFTLLIGSSLLFHTLPWMNLPVSAERAQTLAAIADAERRIAEGETGPIRVRMETKFPIDVMVGGRR